MVPFDVSAFAGRAPRVFQSMASRFNATQVVTRMNQAPKQEAGELQDSTREIRLPLCGAVSTAYAPPDKDVQEREATHA